MADQNKPSNGGSSKDTMSFKEQILADLEAARIERQRRQEALLAKSLSTETSESNRQWQSDSSSDSEAAVAVSRAFVNEVLTDSETLDKLETSEANGSASEVFAQSEVVPETVNSEVSDHQTQLASEDVHEPVPLDLDDDALLDDTLNLSEWHQRSVASETSSETLEEDEDAWLQDKELGDNDMGRDKRRNTNRVAAKISTIFLSVVAFIMLIGGFLGYRYVTSAIGPLDKNATEYVQVEIPSGSGNKLIGQILEEKGVIKSGTIFNYYTKFKNYSGFQSGYYNFQKSMSLDDIVAMLKEGGTDQPERPVLGKIVIPEGYTLKQIAEAITVNSNSKSKKAKTPFTSEEFLAVVQDDDFIAEMTKKYPLLLADLPDKSEVKYLLEGYLFPATYDYYEETTIQDIVDQMLAAMDANLQPYYDQIKNGGMTVNQMLTLASLVEKEGSTDDDRKMIAGVFYNRLNSEMPLQSNIAILYAMDKLGEKTSLADDAAVDTSIDSPYNIYSHTGLMPGPVDSPGLAAIVAAINPASTDNYYFVADVTTGTVYYAETYEEHAANVEKYVNSKLAQ